MNVYFIFLRNIQADTSHVSFIIGENHKPACLVKIDLKATSATKIQFGIKMYINFQLCIVSCIDYLRLKGRPVI